MSDLKTCSKCGIEKLILEFSKDKSKKHGIASRCKKCSVIATREYRASNPGAASVSCKLWRCANPDYASKYSKAWHAANPERSSAINKAWRAKNHEKNREQSRNWARDNPEKIAHMNRRRRAIKRGADGFHTAKDVVTIFASQGGMCANCNRALLKQGKEKFHVDHIMPLKLGGSDWPSNLQCLCPDCNMRKGAMTPEEWAAKNGKLI